MKNKKIHNESFPNSIPDPVLKSLDGIPSEFLDLLPVGIVLLKPHTDDKGQLQFLYTLQNKTAEEYSGHINKAWLNNNTSEFPGIFPLHYYSIFKSVYENANLFKEELVIIKGKKKLYLEINCSKLTDVLLITMQDITHLKELTHQLKSNELSLLETQDLSCIGSFEYNFQNHTLKCTDEIYNILDIKKGSKIKVKDFENLIQSGDKGKVNKILESVLQNIPPFECKFRIVTRSDNEKTVSCKVNILFDEAGYPDQIYGTLSDITERKIIEEEIVRKNKEISLAHKKVEEAKKELEKLNIHLKKEIAKQTQELKDKNKQLLRINKELDSFVYTASHDLKSPILNIEGLLNALVFEISPENIEAQHIISLLNLSIDKFNTTLNDLAEIAQVQNKEDEDHFIDCHSLFEDVKFSIHDEIMKYGANVEADFSKVPVIYFSRNSLRSILLNLISNALKYSTPLRHPEITVSTYEKDGYIVLSVKDNGLGIKPEDKEKIFSVFKRVYTHVSGSGVGLFIVKRIIENNDGKIEVESELNKGSIFRIFIKKKQ